MQNMQGLIHQDESADDLQRDSLVIIQKKTGFRFGTDAVLLSDFAAGAAGARLLDMCTGTGIIPVLLSAKSSAAHICGIEIQEELADMAQRTVRLNGLEDRIDIKCGDLRLADSLYAPHSFDTVTCNPPYMKSGANIKNSTDALSIARHEVMCTLEDAVRAAARMLKYKGRFFMVHRPSRLADIMNAFRDNKIAPKRMRFVYASLAKEPVMLLIEGAYMGGAELHIMPPLVLYDEGGGESEELRAIYGRNSK